MFGSAFDWINDLICWFGQWFPRCAICPITHRGVKFKGHFLRALIGKQKMTITEFGPGLYIWWPVKTTVETMPVKIHDIDLGEQSITTKDEKSVVFHTALFIRVSSVVRASTRTPDLDDIVKQIGRREVTRAVGRRTWKQAQQQLRSVRLLDEIRERTDAALQRFGVRVEDVTIHDNSINKVLRVLGSTETPVVDEDDDE